MPASLEYAGTELFSVVTDYCQDVNIESPCRPDEPLQGTTSAESGSGESVQRESSQSVCGRAHSRASATAVTDTVGAPCLVLVASVLLRWPDTKLAARMVKGFSTVGRIEVSNLFRHLLPQEEAPWLPSLLKDSKLFVDKLEAGVRPDPESAFLSEEYQKDAELGVGSGIVTRDHVTDWFGSENRRPIPWFCTLAAGKRRALDSGKRAHRG